MLVERLAGELNLTSEQRTKVEEILTTRRARLETVQREVRERFDTEQKALRAEIRAVLTTEQQQKFDANERSASVRPPRPATIASPPAGAYLTAIARGAGRSRALSSRIAGMTLQRSLCDLCGVPFRAPTTTAQPAQKARALSHEALWSFQRVGAPVPSPDGSGWCSASPNPTTTRRRRSPISGSSPPMGARQRGA